jgi:hypothetical protein
MSSHTRRINISISLSPEAYSILTEAQSDLSMPISRTLDLIVHEWNEMGQQKQEQVFKTGQTVDSISDRMAELEQGICSILVKLEKADQKGHLLFSRETLEQQLKKSVSS